MYFMFFLNCHKHKNCETGFNTQNHQTRLEHNEKRVEKSQDPVQSVRRRTSILNNFPYEFKRHFLLVKRYCMTNFGFYFASRECMNEC